MNLQAIEAEWTKVKEAFSSFIAANPEAQPLVDDLDKTVADAKAEVVTLAANGIDVLVSDALAGTPIGAAGAKVAGDLAKQAVIDGVDKILAASAPAPAPVVDPAAPVTE